MKMKEVEKGVEAENEQNNGNNLPPVKFYQLFALPQSNQGSIYLFSTLHLTGAPGGYNNGCRGLFYSTLNGRFTLATFTKQPAVPGSTIGLSWHPNTRDVVFPEIGNFNNSRDRSVEVLSLHVLQRKSGHQVFIGIAFAINRRNFDLAAFNRQRANTRSDPAGNNHHQGGGDNNNGNNNNNKSTVGMGSVRLDRTDSVTETGADTKSSPGKSDAPMIESNFFHIYASGLINKEDSPEQQFLAASGQLLFRQSLSFLPTHLTSLSEERTFERPTFVLGGNDGLVHVVTHASRLEFTDEVPTFVRVVDEDEALSALFPDLAQSHIASVKGSSGPVDSSTVTWMSHHVKQVNSEHSIGVSAVGFRDGNVVVTVIDIDSHQKSVSVKSSLLLSHFGPVMSLCLFEEQATSALLNLLVCPSLEPCLVYSLDLDTSPENRQVAVDEVYELPLPTSSSPSPACLPLSAIVADVDFDGELEILVGTCDKTILVYKRHSAHAAAQPTQQANATDDQHSSSATALRENSGAWALSAEDCVAQSPGPIHAMYYGPLLQYKHVTTTTTTNNDRNKNNSTALLQHALSYLAVFTTSGMLIFQHDLRVVMDLCKQRLQSTFAAPLRSSPTITSTTTDDPQPPTETITAN